MKKSKGSASVSSKERTCAEYYVSNDRGKALFNLGIAVVLIAYGFSLIGFALMVQILGLIFALKGIVQLKQSSCTCCC